jgi:hypothetical protein
VGGSSLEPPEKGELVFGEGFCGLIDEIELQRRVTGERLVIPDGFELEGPGGVFFDARGRLDPSVHTGPVTLALVSGKRRVEVRVAKSGMME